MKGMGIAHTCRAHKAGKLGSGEEFCCIRERFGSGAHALESAAKGAARILRVNEAHRVLSQRTVASHCPRVDPQDVSTARSVGKRDLQLDLEAAGAQEGLVEELRPVCQPDRATG